MTTLPGSPAEKGVAITTTVVNTATKHGERPDDEYGPVTRPLWNPPGEYMVPSPPPLSHPPLPSPPVATPTPENGDGAGEEDVYEPIEN